MARDHKDAEDSNGVGPKYVVRWHDAGWEMLEEVTGCSGGEVVTHAVNFINAKRKVKAQPDLYVQDVLRRAVCLTIQEVPRG